MTIELKNRKQYETLNERKIIVQDATGIGATNRVYVHMSLTLGQLLALRHALDSYSSVSPVAMDLHNLLNNAIAVADIV